MESLPQSEARPLAPAVETRAEPVDDAPHLSDPRALQILSTEHWSLLTARSLVYNESFSRGSMFLTFLSASLVALGFVYQGGGPDFVYVLVTILALDLIVGLATLGRLLDAAAEELYALQGMSRIRHAYLEMVPTLEPYFSASHNDDAGSVLAAYGATTARPEALLSFLHGLTTMPGLIGVLDAALVGGLVGSIVSAAGGEMRLAVASGLVAAILAAIGSFVLAFRTFGSITGRLDSRFPTPGAIEWGDQPPGRRNT